MLTTPKPSRVFVNWLITGAISLVWLINGLFCKLLNLVPRHRMIVTRIVGEEHAYLLTKLIGLLEVLMFIWIVSGIKPRWNSLAQVITVATMNIIEAIIAPDLLLFGRMNALLAGIFIIVILINEFFIGNTNTAMQFKQRTKTHDIIP